MKFVKLSKLKKFPKHQICCRNNTLLSFIADLEACTIATIECWIEY